MQAQGIRSRITAENLSIVALGLGQTGIRGQRRRPLWGYTWQFYGALGCQITRNIYSEIGYRYLYLDYDTTDFILQAALHGAQITVGLKF